MQLSSWHFLSYRSSSASALLTFGVSYLGTLLWCDKHARCVLNNDAECWGCSVFNVFSASLSLAISVDVQQREGHRVQTILSNQESALLYATSSIATSCFEAHKGVKMPLVRVCWHSQHLWIYGIWLLLPCKSTTLTLILTTEIPVLSSSHTLSSISLGLLPTHLCLNLRCKIWPFFDPFIKFC